MNASGASRGAPSDWPALVPWVPVGRRTGPYVRQRVWLRPRIALRAAHSWQSAANAMGEPTDLHPARRHVPALDGVRGLAILAVMAFHFTLRMLDATPGDHLVHGVLGAGWTGVGLFFVLSGLLVTRCCSTRRTHRTTSVYAGDGRAPAGARRVSRRRARQWAAVRRRALGGACSPVGPAASRRGVALGPTRSYHQRTTNDARRWSSPPTAGSRLMTPT